MSFGAVVTMQTKSNMNCEVFQFYLSKKCTQKRVPSNFNKGCGVKGFEFGSIICFISSFEFSLIIGVPYYKEG
jgi:hypothetical protein